MGLLSKFFSRFKKQKVEQTPAEAWPWPSSAPKESITPEEPEVKVPAKKATKSKAGKK